eukprot:5284077-Pleurochrysis_carterae.AAC.3
MMGMLAYACTPIARLMGHFSFPCEKRRCKAARFDGKLRKLTWSEDSFNQTAVVRTVSLMEDPKSQSKQRCCPPPAPSGPVHRANASHHWHKLAGLAGKGSGKDSSRCFLKRLAKTVRGANGEAIGRPYVR